ncbi:MAG: biopolymer transporter ExbD [Candidatus Eisenbacteria bacterium]
MIARSRIRRKRRGAGILTLTSLVDILTILLIFLLKSFAPEGALLHAAQDLELPESSSPEGVSEGDLVLALTGNEVTLGEERVLGCEEVLAGTGLYVPGLAEALAEASGGEPGSRRLLIEGDRRIPFSVLYRILFTCHQSGYQDLALAAVEREPAEGETP